MNFAILITFTQRRYYKHTAKKINARAQRHEAAKSHLHTLFAPLRRSGLGLNPSQQVTTE